MDVTVNGAPLALEPGTTVRGLVERLGLARGLVAVEHNGRTVPRDDHRTTLLLPGDVLEVVSFVGGG